MWKLTQFQSPRDTWWRTTSVGESSGRLRLLAKCFVLRGEGRGPSQLCLRRRPLSLILAVLPFQMHVNVNVSVRNVWTRRRFFQDSVHPTTCQETRP